MLTMTCLAAPNQFGTLIGASQHQPVTVTRHWRPVAAVLSYKDTQRTQTIPYEVAKAISKRFPLRRQKAAASLAQHPAEMSSLTAEDGLTEEEVARLLHDK